MRSPITLLTPLLALIPAATTAIPPPPPPAPSGYYGPLTVCRDGFAVSVADDEAYQTPDLLIRSTRGGLSIERFIYNPARDADIVRPAGTLIAPDLGELTRVVLTSRNSDWRGIGYLLKSRESSYFPYWVIQSDGLDGTDRDLTVLTRVKAGPAAAAACAAVPPGLQPTPEREDRDTVWFIRAAKPGPTTACFLELALDLKPGERARVPWGNPKDSIAAKIETASGAITIFGVLRPPPAGRVLGQGDYVLNWPKPIGARTETFGRIVRAGQENEIIARGPSLSVALAGSITKDEAAAILNRLRASAPEDRCFG